MTFYTTIKLYKRIVDFWYIAGISPLRFTSTDCDKAGNGNIDVESLGEHSVDRDYIFLTSEESRRKFYVFQVDSWKSARPSFWITLAFAIFSFIFSSTQLIRFSSRPSADIPSIIGSCCWCSYMLSCFFIYIVHLFKSKNICTFLMEWQQVEGEIFCESKSMIFLHETQDQGFWEDKYNVPKFVMRSQRRGMRPFLITIPASIILMGFNIAFTPRYPMYLYSLVPQGSEIIWLKVVCFLITWMEVYFFALCENQIEILFTAFSRSVSNCLRILTMPAKILGPHNNSNFIDLQNNYSAVDVLSMFEDSVKHFRRINLLVRHFNKIFAWPIFVFKAFTMIRLCCYVYVILKHPKETAFPATMVFPYAVIAIFIKFGLTLTSLGNVLNQTGKFLKSWKELLLLLNQHPNWRERQLKSCSQFGFRCGNFYTIHPQTILTFYSVTLTYLIILLQL